MKAPITGLIFLTLFLSETPSDAPSVSITETVETIIVIEEEPEESCCNCCCWKKKPPPVDVSCHYSLCVLCVYLVCVCVCVNPVYEPHVSWGVSHLCVFKYLMY